jgi:hypothetical protein
MTKMRDKVAKLYPLPHCAGQGTFTLSYVRSSAFSPHICQDVFTAFTVSSAFGFGFFGYFGPRSHPILLLQDRYS